MFTLKTKLKVGDLVAVIAGKEKGKQGKVMKIDKKRGRVIVEGLNKVKRHQKGNEQVASKIIEKEAGINISNIMAYSKSKTKCCRIKKDLVKIEGKTKKVRKLVGTNEEY